MSYLYLILIMKNQTEQIKKPWLTFQKQNDNWLKNFYRKMGVDERRIQQTLEKNADIVKRMEKLVQEPPYKGKYFQAFKTYRQEKYFLRTITLNAAFLQSQLSQISAGLRQQQHNNNRYTTQCYENFNLMINLLSDLKYQFQYIAKHYYIEKNKGRYEISFSFQVERGEEYGPVEKEDKKYQIRQKQIQEGKLFWYISNRLIYYILIRDIAAAINQLQKFEILHGDLVLHNVILINCEDLRDLKDLKKLQIIKNKIRFKIIDFGDALMMSINKNGNIRLQEKTDKIFDLIPHITIKDVQLREISNLRDLKAKGQYKKMHSLFLLHIIEQVSYYKQESQQNMMSQPIKVIDKNEKEQLKLMVENHDYGRLIRELNQKINQPW